jgi:hypothetical protein
MMLGDLEVIGEWPAKMVKALAVIACHAHQAYDACSGFPPGASHDKCLFMSLAVRDFLVTIGYRDATVRGCALYVFADDKEGNQLWSVGVGLPDQLPIEGKFNGHAVVWVPSINLLIDTTVYQAHRPKYFGAMPGMIAVAPSEPQHGGIRSLYRLPVICSVASSEPDREVCVTWLDRPELPWRKSEDFRVRNARRIAVTRALVAAFGEWRD